MVRSPEGEQLSLTEYSYNFEKGLITAETSYWNGSNVYKNVKSNTVHGKEVYRNEWDYDKLGNSVGFAEYGADNKLICRATMSTYPAGVYPGIEDGVFQKDYFMYDKNNQLEWKDEYTYERQDDGTYVKITKHTDMKTGKETITRLDEEELNLNITNVEIR